ncbi:MAG: aspartate aminotransferase family protein [Bacteroidetes bacterium 4572_77]|nr:MAG: aspartate aminotransferase family protein [Bacteroidetes bacterium 4572_77]
MHLTNRQLYYQHLATPAYVPEAIEFVSSKGIYMITNTGEKYVDLVSGVSVSNVGHGHEKVIAAIKKQVDSYMHLMVYGEFIQSPQVQLAGLLTKYLPKQLDAVFYVNSGSEANEGAMKLAKRATGRSEIIAFKKAYHGSTHGALSILGSEEMKYAYRPLLPDIKFLDFNEQEQLTRITEKTAAVVVESIQAEAGIILPKQGYLKALKDRCEAVGALLILDDVQMGFGRTGKLFSFENYDYVPHIITLAKGMGGGMPIGAFVASKNLMDMLQTKPALGHITTFGGHPVSCAAAKASLEVILEEQLSEKAHKKGQMFVDVLKKHEKVKEVRQQGLMLAVELESKEMGARAMEVLWKNNLIVDQFLFNRTSFRIAPPLTITTEEIEDVIQVLWNSLNDL